MLPVPPFAVIVIVPSLTLQSVGSVNVTSVTVAAAGTDKIAGLLGSAVTQFPSSYLTNTL